MPSSRTRKHPNKWNEPYLDHPLLRELIPIRITPPPSTERGPSALWAAVERQRVLWAGEFNADLAASSGVEQEAG